MLKPISLHFCALLPMFIATNAVAGFEFEVQPWPNKTVIYKYDATVPQKTRQIFEEVIGEINNKTTVNFRPLTNSDSQRPFSYLNILKVDSLSPSSCSAPEGYRPPDYHRANPLEIKINNSSQCASYASVLGHLVQALGLPGQSSEWIESAGATKGRLSNVVIKAINDYADRPNDFNPHGLVSDDSPYISKRIKGLRWHKDSISIEANTSREKNYRLASVLVKNGEKLIFHKVESAHQEQNRGESMFKVESYGSIRMGGGDILFLFKFTPKLGRVGSDRISIHFANQNVNRPIVQTVYLPVSIISPQN